MRKNNKEIYIWNTCHWSPSSLALIELELKRACTMNRLTNKILKVINKTTGLLT